ncbi:hypothetical protein CONLIGDRAFT_671808 [Coniochaeta ligniaria NRRL 30616]|uniref:Uncharacterized protein n=1 Tax=Coniochaeta ligniaria NRRL 30616 TaxID=1408157 RepID=A0A1J7JKH5_9PEZI|nr:hypothetical protein CONLIGDRAFT_671808 [Coniochaeta ligniaria NRRL 30616]
MEHSGQGEDPHDERPSMSNNNNAPRVILNPLDNPGARQALRELPRETLGLIILSEIFELPTEILVEDAPVTADAPQGAVHADGTQEDNPTTSDTPHGNVHGEHQQDEQQKPDVPGAAVHAVGTQQDNPTSDTPRGNGLVEDQHDEQPKPDVPEAAVHAEDQQMHELTESDTPPGNCQVEDQHDEQPKPDVPEAAVYAVDAQEDKSMTSDTPHGNAEVKDQHDEQPKPEVAVHVDDQQIHDLTASDTITSPTEPGPQADLTLAENPQSSDISGQENPPNDDEEFSLATASTMCKSLVDNILEDQKLLSKIVQVYEEEIRKRWKSRNRDKRRSLLLNIWPGIPKTTHPVLGGRDPVTGMPDGAPRTLEDHMFPHLNLDDLSQIAPLLLLLNSRGRHHPCVFTMADFESTVPGEKDGWVSIPTENTLKEYSVRFCEEDNYACVEVSRPLSGTPHELLKEACARERARIVSVSKGLRILSVQCKLYRFLVEVARKILPDKPTDLETLSDPSTPVVPEPSSASANNNETGITHLATTVFEAPYRVPFTMDLAYMKSLILSMRRLSMDDLWALRDNPAYFSDKLLDHKEHITEGTAMMDSSSLAPKHQDNISLVTKKRRTTVEGAYEAISSPLLEFSMWERLHIRIKDLSAMQRKYPNVNAEDEPPKEFAAALRYFYYCLTRQYAICAVMVERFMKASPSMRQYFKLRHVTSHQNDGSRYAMVTPLIEMIDGSPSHVRAALWAFEPLQMSIIGVLSECIRQVELFYPSSELLQTERKLYANEHSQQEHKQLQFELSSQSYDPQNSLASLALLLGGRFDYPVDEPRTQANVDKMRSAVKQLDSFWNQLESGLKAAKVVLPDRCRRVLEEAAKHVWPPWEFDPMTPAKTPSQTAIEVSRKAKKVINSLFHTPSDKSSPPGPMSWSDFSYAMSNMGFNREKLHGSAWLFTPKKGWWQFTTKKGTQVERPGIIFHEPPPGVDIPFVTVREHAMRLYRAYDMTKAHFVVKVGTADEQGLKKPPVDEHGGKEPR